MLSVLEKLVSLEAGKLAPFLTYMIMAKYIDADRLKTKIVSLRNHANESITADEPKHRTFYKTGKAEAFDKAIFLIDSLKQEQSIDSDILHDKLVDFLIKNDISEEKAKFLANQIADIYGSQRYIDGLCDGLKQKQPKIDIEKTVEEYLINNHEFLIKHDSKTVVQALARYFYELGLNTKK